MSFKIVLNQLQLNPFKTVVKIFCAEQEKMEVEAEKTPFLHQQS